MSYQPRLSPHVDADERRERLGLQRSMASLQAELAAAQARLSSRLAAAEARIVALEQSVAANTSGLAALEAEPEIFAVAYGRTNGAGGFTTERTYGCSLSISGNAIQVTFDALRPVDYSVAALNASIQSRFCTVGNESAAFANVFFISDTGSTISAATTAFDFMIHAIGPRP